MDFFSMSYGGSSSGNTHHKANGHGVLLSPGVRSYAGSASFSSSLVLDSVRGELVEAPAVKLERKAVVVAQRSVETLKNHSEAERRRRARINTHFDTLRALLPGSSKMDKASLLGEVINHLKDLKRKAIDANEQHSSIPKDTDELKVELENNNCNCQGIRPNNYSMRVSLSCNYRPGLLSDLRQVLEAVDLITTSTEISTLGCRMKNVFVMTARGDRVEVDEAQRRFHAQSICKAVRSVIENISSSDEFLRSSLSNKRRRLSGVDP